jgi:hypothetical protein
VVALVGPYLSGFLFGHIEGEKDIQVGDKEATRVSLWLGL